MMRGACRHFIAAMMGCCILSAFPAWAQVAPADALPVLPAVTLPQSTAAVEAPVLLKNGIPALPENTNQPGADATKQGATGEVNALVAAPQEVIRYSYGDVDIGSILFGPAEMKAMKETLRSWESRRDAPVLVEEALPETVVPVAPLEAKTYPVFYLSSVVYRNPGDWVLWVNGEKITPKKNATEVKVLSVSASNASFSWTPSYAPALTLRQEKKLFASADALKHRLSNAATFRYDPLLGTAFFSLKPNQSFAAGYMNVFEGNVESPALSAIDPNVLATVAIPSNTPPPLPESAPALAASPVTPDPATMLAAPVASDVSVDRAMQVPPAAPALPVAPAAPATANVPPAAIPALSKIPSPSAASESLGELPLNPAP